MYPLDKARLESPVDLDNNIHLPSRITQGIHRSLNLLGVKLLLQHLVASSHKCSSGRDALQFFRLLRTENKT